MDYVQRGRCLNEPARSNMVVERQRLRRQLS